jgi:hypothetical protein
MVQLNGSKIFFDTERGSETLISAIKVKGFEGTEYAGKRVKRFNIAIDLEDRDMKNSNYFDESNDDLGLYSLAPPKYGDFTVGQFETMGTFPVQTYLFDTPLKERLRE